MTHVLRTPRSAVAALAKMKSVTTTFILIVLAVTTVLAVPTGKYYQC